MSSTHVGCLDSSISTVITTIRFSQARTNASSCFVPHPSSSTNNRPSGACPRIAHSCAATVLWSLSRRAPLRRSNFNSFETYMRVHFESPCACPCTWNFSRTSSNPTSINTSSSCFDRRSKATSASPKNCATDARVAVATRCTSRRLFEAFAVARAHVASARSASSPPTSRRRAPSAPRADAPPRRRASRRRPPAARASASDVPGAATRGGGFDRVVKVSYTWHETDK